MAESKSEAVVGRRTIMVELFLLSFLSLFFELLIIRWLSADLRAFTVFRTFPLIACFVGLGVGFALRDDKVFPQFMPATLLFAVTVTIANALGICFWGFPSLANFQWQNLVGLIADPGWAYILAFSLIVILLLAGPFAMCVCIGSRLGVLFNQLPALPAYSINVLGAITGGTIFPLLCYLGWSPCQLLLLAALAIVCLMWRTCKKKVNIVNVSIVVSMPLLLLAPQIHSKPLNPNLLNRKVEFTTLWSPYQRLDLSRFFENKGQQADAEHEQFIGLELGANRAFYQYFFSPELIRQQNASDAGLLRTIAKDYALPFSFNHPKSALIVGAGTGQNVSSALEAGLTDIDAVEIDPVILDLGRRFNPDYKNTSAHLICDDARHYFSQCQKKYDVINFSTLDSHVVSGLGSSVRIDAYVYTRESIQQALKLLTDDGILLASFVTVAPWTENRLFTTFKEAAGYAPICSSGMTVGSIYILGKRVQNGELSLPAGYARKQLSNELCLTDDWPYLYVRSDLIDYPYLLVVLEILLLSIFAARRFLFTNRDAVCWQLFFLGAAFMMLELHAISFLSLLYGSTWMTSALAINGILVLILCANVVVIKFGNALVRMPAVPYCLLAASILIDWWLPANQILGLGTAGYAIASFSTILPMGIAGVIFATSLSRTQDVSKALAFNLFGAVVGGLLEYLSNYWGVRSLLLVSFFLYLLSFCCLTASRRGIVTNGASHTNEDVPQ